MDRKNRSDWEGGGVGFLIRNDIKDKVEIIDTTDGTDTEILWIKLEFHKHSNSNHVRQTGNNTQICNREPI